MSDKAVGERTSLVIKTICSWVQTPQVRSELRIKMKGFETQVIGQEPKVRQSVSLFVGLEIRRGKTGVREKRVKSEMTRRLGLEMSLLLFPLDRHCGPGKPEGEKLRNLWAGTMLSLPSTCVHRELRKC